MHHANLHTASKDCSNFKYLFANSSHVSTTSDTLFLIRRVGVTDRAVRFTDAGSYRLRPCSRDRSPFLKVIDFCGRWKRGRRYDDTNQPNNAKKCKSGQLHVKYLLKMGAKILLET